MPVSECYCYQGVITPCCYAITILYLYIPLPVEEVLSLFTSSSVKPAHPSMSV